MRIGIATFGCDGGRSGIGQYLIQLMRGFTTCGSNDEFELLALEGEKEVFVIGAGETQLTIADRYSAPMVNLLWQQTSLPVWCWRRGYDILFVAAGNRRLPFALPCPVVGTVHDLAPVHIANKYNAVRQFYVKHVLPMLVRRLDRVITVSASSRDDVVKYAHVPPQRVTVIHNGVDHGTYRPFDRDAARARVIAECGLDQPYILYVARLEHPGKNHVRLIEAFDRLKGRTDLPHQLVLAGPDKERADEVHAAASRSRYSRDIKFLGFVPDAALPSLYRAADVFALPSLFEGFGIPVIEAMACGTPVVCSNAGALPEVASNAALMFDPLDVDSMTTKLEIVLRNATVRSALIEQGRIRSQAFHWKRTAQQTLDVLHAVRDERRVLQRCRA